MSDLGKKMNNLLKAATELHVEGKKTLSMHEKDVDKVDPELRNKVNIELEKVKKYFNENSKEFDKLKNK